MLYQDPEQHGRFVWLASDLDQTMGSTLKANRSSTADSAFQRLDRYGLFDQTANRPLVNELFQIKQFKLIEQDVEWDQSLDAYRPNNFLKNKQMYDDQLNQKVLQLPLGPDFIDRINNKAIDFNAAIEGPIKGHPSITSLFTWFTETSQYLDEFVRLLESK
ncbi:hypothetical protein G6F42_023678 [Rhizopus arrhizus]|nr:hypothetical protein G6F42_023678 [Rhizopus arrhizus]